MSQIQTRDKLYFALDRLANLKPEYAKALKIHNNKHWMFSMIKLSGSNLTQDDLNVINNGEVCSYATLEDYSMIERLRKLREEFSEMSILHNEPDAASAICFNKILRDGGDVHYRSSDGYDDTLEHRLPPAKDIPAIMEALTIKLKKSEDLTDPVYTAVLFHDLIMSIKPFDTMNELTACACMDYALLYAGFPLPALLINRDDHIKLTWSSVREDHKGTFYGLITENLLCECGKMSIDDEAVNEHRKRKRQADRSLKDYTDTKKEMKINRRIRELMVEKKSAEASENITGLFPSFTVDDISPSDSFARQNIAIAGAEDF